MRIDIWSDVVCPFCWIGKRHLERALEEFRAEHPDAEVEILWRAFQLDPNAAAESSETVPEMIARKYSIPFEAAVESQEQIAAQFEAVGLEFNWRDAKAGNTFDAHRLAAMASDRDLDDEADEALKKAYFTDGRLVSDHAVLREVGESIGLPGDEVAAMLASDEYSLDVRHDMTIAQGLGISGVPFFVFDGKFAVNGAQPVAVFRQALDTAWVESQKEDAEDGGDARSREAGVENDAAGDATAPGAAGNPDCSDGSCSVQQQI
ncbi:DsbA family oxidoreductase [Corynebacterium hansenii]|uniref:DsbA family oxidoreductase n=1 Tax=Corynebacterium hansenii TaxID=394964 RepID=A0ABV7ZMU9_9CORY|nr:DsbA family oxidoreductase [Corynebacterium hansenii]WJY99438.1 DSBA-like thioredoxin domain protein [Corynebacterium hansenii]